MITQSIRTRHRAVIPYVTAGLPSLDATGRTISALADAGAAAIEIGIPFSDPMADGPVLQRASQKALQAGFRMDALMERLDGWSAMIDIPLIVMSYINP
ncbi:MAG TPA: tryptophan synthase subunit alpha, partial [Desulfomonilia bacterium]|nr:tryptophan synthase subunit alpha [Desulfomonilia bacterium]